MYRIGLTLQCAGLDLREKPRRPVILNVEAVRKPLSKKEGYV